MRILHTADLHIGKTVNGFSMLEDQQYVLTQIVDIAKKRQVQAVILAGDIYDRAVPPAEAVCVLNAFIDQLHRLGAEIFCISGNHDSPERISFAQEILEKNGVHFAGVYKDACKQVRIEDRELGGMVEFTLMPFVKPALLGETTNDACVMHMLADTFLPQKEQECLYGREEKSEEKALKQDGITPQCWKETQEAIEQRGQSLRQVLITHYFVTNGGRLPEVSDSETQIAVGGLDNVDASRFRGFVYTALGHIHKPQRMDLKENGESAAGAVVYAGAPIAYSFSECGQEKSVVVVTLSAAGEVELETEVLHPLRKMRKLKGELTNLIDPMVANMENTEDYLQITLTNEEELIDPIGILRRVYPNIMQLLFEKRNWMSDEEFTIEIAEDTKPMDELFADFYELVRGHAMDEERKKVIQEAVKQAMQE